MKILAIDSSGLVASAALMEDNNFIAEYTVQYKKTHSQTLLPMVEEICRMVELDLATVDAIAVAAGPGSFTGLRIGSATAKGLAFALKKPIIPVPTVDGLAYQLYGAADLVCPIMDARRNQVYTGIYEFIADSSGHFKYDMRVIRQQCAVSFEEISEALNEIDRSVIFLGDGVPVFRERMEETLRVPYTIAPVHRSRQSAAAVAALGSVYYRKGIMESGDAHAPIYLRLSQAEREKSLRDLSQRVCSATSGENSLCDLSLGNAREGSV